MGRHAAERKIQPRGDRRCVVGVIWQVGNALESRIITRAALCSQSTARPLGAVLAKSGITSIETERAVGTRPASSPSVVVAHPTGNAIGVVVYVRHLVFGQTGSAVSLGLELVNSGPKAAFGIRVAAERSHDASGVEAVVGQ